MGCPAVTRDDAEAALRDLGTYIDISPDDLQTLCLLAIKRAEQRMAQSMPVREVMTTKVISVRREADLHEASRLLSENRISGLPVVDDELRVIGVITEKDVMAMTGIGRGHTTKDLIRHLLGEPLPRRHEGGKVEDFMSSPAITVPPETGIRQAAAIMNERGVKRLIVVEGDGRLAGIIARADIVRVIGA
jgi:CBS domain-containing membrane protein